MILDRFYDDKLAHASYLVGCAATGEALVVDPGRDVDQYIDAADRRGLAITRVTETHIHADFVSGARELGARTGATLYLSKEGGPDWQYAYAEDSDATLIGDGDEFMVGNVKIEVLHTPGHTPEHLSFMFTDTAATDIPMGIFTGDFLFVGDVGRPDLLEKAAKIEGTMETGARQLFRSLRRFDALPGHLQVWPAHGAGSACGKALGAVPSSTLGYERTVNWAFKIDAEEEFVAEVLSGQPEPPKYFAEMKRINKVGPSILGAERFPKRLPESQLESVMESAATVIDTRRWEDFSNAHVPGTINIPLDASFTNWAGWLLSYESPFYLILDTSHGAHAVQEVTRDLASIGLVNVAGYFEVTAVDDWPRDHGELGQIEEIDDQHLAARYADFTVVDVRGLTEWNDGHLPNAIHIPLGYLMDRLAEIPLDTRIVVQCFSGARSAIGASILRRAGLENVLNLRGGYARWRKSGHDTVTDVRAAMV